MFPVRLLLHLALAIGAFFLVCCSTDKTTQSCDNGNCDHAREFSLYTPGNRYGWGGQDEYLDEIQPILAKRCVACHGCSDSPCQLKLTSYEGLMRGSSENNVFSVSLLSQEPNRLKDGRFTRVDGTVNYAASAENWREADFYSVIDGQDDSLMSKLLIISDKMSEYGRGPSTANDTFALYESGLKQRTFECAGSDASKLSNQELAARAMPFGLEPLESGDFEKIVDWIRRGAKGPSQAVQRTLRTPSNVSAVEKWERFFNGGTTGKPELKRYLMARYIYEHIFFANIELAESPGEFYELVRSRTPPGRTIDEIVTDHIMEDPDTARVFYRLRKVVAIIARKTHTVWPLDDATLAHYETLFLAGKTEEFVLSYDVSEDPGYEDSLNPFQYFEQIPGQIRAQFMIENSKKLVQSLILADVCLGTTATYAIRDHFWAWFLKPSADPSALFANRLASKGDVNPFASHSIWETDDEGDYQESVEYYMRLMHPEGLSLDDVWTGAGNDNPNSWLTVLRHDKSATVEWGAVGGLPDTAWVLTYSNFERLYYNLTVNYLTWLGAADQLATWTYMSNIRTEGEDLMLSFFPSAIREQIRAEWTAGFDHAPLFSAVGAIKEGKILSLLSDDSLNVEGGSDKPRPTNVLFATQAPRLPDLLQQMHQRRAETIGFQDVLNSDPSEGQKISPIASFYDFERGLNAITGSRTAHARDLPNLTIIRITDNSNRSQYYTLVANRGYSSHDFVFGASRARTCANDYLSAYRGIVGNYPELFVDLTMADATEFLQSMQSIDVLGLKTGWSQFIKRYLQQGTLIQRDSPAFWPFVDDLHTYLADPTQNVQNEAGIIDLSEYVWFNGNRFMECGNY